MSAVERFLVFVVLMAVGTAWLLIVAAPVLIGLPATWENAGYLGCTVPTFAAYIAAFAVSIGR